MKIGQLIPNDKLLMFDRDHHIYTHYKCGSLTSVTTKIKQYSKKFDAESESKRIAARDGIDAKELIARWESKRDGAAELGTRVHAIAERVVNLSANKWCLKLEIPLNPCPQVTALYRWFATHLEIFYGRCQTEHRICWPEAGLAGTIDLYCTNYNGRAAIIDYKTNEEISIYGRNKMLPPFQQGKKLKLEDSAMSHYSLQLNLYRAMLRENYDIDVDYMVLVHLDRYGEFHEYQIPVMDNHVEALTGVELKYDAKNPPDAGGFRPVCDTLSTGEGMPEESFPSEF